MVEWPGAEVLLRVAHPHTPAESNPPRIWPVATANRAVRAHYGLDAPGVVRNMAMAAAAGIGGGLAVRHLGWGPVPLAGALLRTGLGFGTGAALMVWSSLVGKLRTRDRILDAIPWRGDEQVLDVGCGHGLLLLGAARRLSASGHATGIDLWQDEDQASNSAEATMRNARAEGVADRVSLDTGDARKLPYPDASFDVVVSSFAIHNIYDAGGREAAIGEVVRVLKPGGWFGVMDIRHGNAYARHLRARGMMIERRWWNLLFVLTRVIVARKPGSLADRPARGLSRA